MMEIHWKFKLGGFVAVAFTAYFLRTSVCSCFSDFFVNPPPLCMMFFLLHLPKSSFAYAYEPTTAWLACCQADDASATALSYELVSVLPCVCGTKSAGIFRTWPAHFACSSGDRCSWASTGAWQLPFIAVFSTLNPWPTPPSHLPPRLTSSHGTWLGYPEWWAAEAAGASCIRGGVVWCGRLVTIQHCQARKNQAVHAHT